MPFDYKKEYKEFYLPPCRPVLVQIPEMHFVAVRGKGDPNEENGAYQRAMQLLYGISFTVKMSKKGDRRIAGYFDYVVPPLEGLWQQTGSAAGALDYSRKDDFAWISMIRLPDFVTRDDFDWAVAEASAKKKTDFSALEFLTFTEGLCVQCMHIGSYDSEPDTIAIMHAFMDENGLASDFSETRRHHEIYLSDARRTMPEKLKTVIRLPVKPEQK